MAQKPIKKAAIRAAGDGLNGSDAVDEQSNTWITGSVSITGVTVGPAPSSGSFPVVIASDQAAVAVKGAVATVPPTNASTNIGQVGGQAISEGQKAMAQSLPVAIASDQTPVLVKAEGVRFTYSAAINAHAPAATPTDWFTIRGSTSGLVVRITALSVALRATAANQYRVSVAKYSTLYTGGTSAAVTMVAHDSKDDAATATVLTWAAGLPTVGTLVGNVTDDSLPVAVLGTPVFNNEPGAGVLYDFGVRNTQPIVLRTPSQYLALNSAGVALPAGLVADVRIQWTEDVA